MSELEEFVIWQFARAELDENRLELRVAGELVDIEARPMDLLLLLLRHAGKAVTSQEISDEVWPERRGHISEKVISNNVHKIRMALGDTNHGIIQTLPRKGYRLLAEVTRRTVHKPAPEFVELEAGQLVRNRPQWKLVKRLAAGGYGEAWLAQQVETGERHVFKFSFRVQQSSALKRETTISRLLQKALPERTEFVPIVDWDFERVPYFIESEFSGANLREWSDAAGGLDKIPLATRIELIAGIADAIGAAHVVGVLHLDLKPENILLADEEGELLARICDFGAGRLIDRGALDQLKVTALGFSRTAAVDSNTGTAAYIAPEIYSGGARTERCDVYSLGVLLYQLVVGDLNRPIATGWEAQIDDVALRSDIAHCTQGDPDRRLASAQLLAQRLRSLDARRAELQRQRSEEIRAAEAFEAIKRARARRPWLVVASLAILAGAAVGAYLYAQEQRQARTTAALNSFLTEDILQAASPRNGGSKDMTLLAAIQQSVPRVEQRFSDQPDIEAAVDDSLGNVFEELSEYSEAAEAFRREVLLDTSLYGPNEVRTLVGQVHLAEVLLETTDRPDGVRLLRQAYPMLIKRLHHDDPQLLYVRYLDARLTYLESRLTEAREAVAPLLEDCRRLIPDSALTAKVEELYLALLGNEAPDRAEELEVEARKQIAVANRRFGEKDIRTLKIRYFLAHALIFEGRYAEAEVELKGTITDLIQRLGPNHIMIARCDFELDRLYSTQGRWDKAADAVHEAWQVYQRDMGPESSSALHMQAVYGMEIARLGRSAEALPLVEQAESKALKLLGRGNVVYGTTLFALGSVYAQMHRRADEQRVADEFRAIVSQPPYAGNSGLLFWVAGSHFLNAQLAFDSGDQGAARREGEIARQLYLKDRDRGYVVDVDDFLKSLGAAASAAK